MDRFRRRLDDIVILKDEVLQALRVQGSLLAEAVENNQEANTGMVLQRSSSLKDIVDDDVKRESVIRNIALAIEEVGDMLYPYTRSVDRHPSYCVSDDYKEPELWRITLDVPVTMSESTTSYLRVLIHEYAVGRTLLEWCRIFLVDKVADQVAAVEDIKEKIRAAKDRRNKPIRRRGSIY